MYQTFVNSILKYEATAYAAKHHTGRFVDSFIFYIRIIYNNKYIYNIYNRNFFKTNKPIDTLTYTKVIAGKIHNNTRAILQPTQSIG